MARKIKKGDKVQVIAGKYKGQEGDILEVLAQSGRVRVEGLAKQLRHLKPGQDSKIPQGGIIEKVGSIHISNVQLLDPKTNKPTKVGYSFEGGKKTRVARSSGTVID